MPQPTTGFQHPNISRRTAIQAGSVGLLGLGMNHLDAFRAAAAASVPDAQSVRDASRDHPAKAVIYIFLSGGLAQQDSFDLKPDAPANIRGEFTPIATKTPGVQICEHLPMLAARSDKWALIRSLTHPSNDHSLGHAIMLSGRSTTPTGFRSDMPTPFDHPSIAAVVGEAIRVARPESGVARPEALRRAWRSTNTPANTPVEDSGRATPRHNLPPAVVLPERIIHRTGRVIPGQFAGEMGRRREPWFIEAAPFNATTYGAYPEYEFHHARGRENKKGLTFQAPSLTLPHGLTQPRVNRRLSLLNHVERQRRDLDQFATAANFDRYRQGAISLLTDQRVKRAFDVRTADDKTQDRYGRNSFGWSLLMAHRLVEAGVSLVQVNLGNNETWDTHGNAFPHLKNVLFPPTDRALSALIDDLAATGRLDSTLIVMAGEFGRTPRITGLPQHYKLPGRDHWGAVQTVFVAGGGIKGGTIIGRSDPHAGYPAADPQKPENLAATIYHHLGIPATAVWKDDLERPHAVYWGEAVRGLGLG
jgi:hypothetical protein